MSNYFDTNKPILQSLIEEAEKCNGDLSDDMVSQAIDEYNIEEVKVYEAILTCITHEFYRWNRGFTVKKSQKCNDNDIKEEWE